MKSQLFTLILILFTVIVSGCGNIHLYYLGDEDEYKKSIEQLIGSDIDTVEAKLGRPTSRVRHYNSMTYIYVRPTYEKALDPILVIDNLTLLCYRLKFNENNELVDFKRSNERVYGIDIPKYSSARKLCQIWIESRDRYNFSDPWNKRKSKPYNPDNVPAQMDYYECDYKEEAVRKSTFDRKPAIVHSFVDEDELTAEAMSENHAAQLQLYWNDSADGLYWLCRAANQGYPKARYRIAQLYEFGDDGIDRDLLNSYMWYDLAAKSCHPWARKDVLRVSRDSLNEEQRKEANNMIEKWIPIDCSIWR